MLICVIIFQLWHAAAGDFLGSRKIFRLFWLFLRAYKRFVLQKYRYRSVWTLLYLHSGLTALEKAGKIALLLYRSEKLRWAVWPPSQKTNPLNPGVL